MSDPIQAPQGIEQKLVFRSEQDRAAALEALDTAPAAGTSLDTWRREQDMAQDAIESAQIDPNYIPGQQSAAPPNVPGANPPAPALQEDDWYKPADWTLVQNGQNVTIGRDEIPTEFRERIFQKFAQADDPNTYKGGSGLGLNIAKLLIEKMDGKIGFETETDVGTTFYFDLPEIGDFLHIPGVST